VGDAALSVQIGDLATWVGGIGTAGALFFTWATLKITRAEQREARTEKRQAQARLVSAWADHVEPTGDNGFHKVTVKVQNSSDEPVYGVRLAVGASWSSDKVRYAQLSLIDILPPRCTQQHDALLQLGATPDGSYEPSPPVEMIFYDATHGGLWLRDRFGALVRIRGGAPSSVAEDFFKRPVSPDAGRLRRWANGRSRP